MMCCNICILLWLIKLCHKVHRTVILSVHFEDYIQACDQVPGMLLNCIIDHPVQFVGVSEDVKYIAALKLLYVQLFFLFCAKKKVQEFFYQAICKSLAPACQLPLAAR